MTKTAFCGWRARGGTRPFTQLLLVMKLTFFLLTAACLHVSAGALSQQVTFSGKDVSLEKVFTAVESQTGYFFLYPSTILREARKVTVDVRDMPLGEFLDLIFRDQALKYFIDSKTINVSVAARGTAGGVASAPQVIPPIDIKGRITNEAGEAVAGVSVMVKGTSNGATTNSNGEFALSNVDSKAFLVISGTNVETVEVAVENRTLLLFTAKTKVSPLDEVQIIAYGTTSRRFATGNTATVKAKDIEKQPVQNPLLALQGRVPGLVVTQNTGIAGGGITVRIQGQNSIGNGNTPLYVVDGVPLNTIMPSTGLDEILGKSENNIAGNPLSYINPSDISSIDILKDADATSIYGSRAANGAILITTKKGKVGKTMFNLNCQSGAGVITRKVDMMNTRQYLDMRYEAFKNDGLPIPSIQTNPGDGKYDINGTWDTTRNTDWQKELIGKTAKYTSLNANVSGGNSMFQYLVGATYAKQTTVFPLPSDFADQKGSVHFNLNTTQNSSQRFRLQLSGNYMIDHNKLPGIDLTKAAIRTVPDAPPLYNEDGSLNWAQNESGISTFFNPLAALTQSYENTTKNLISNLEVGYRIINGVELSSGFGYSNMVTNDFVPSPLISIQPELRPFGERASTFGTRMMSSWIIEPKLTGKRNIGSGVFEGLIGSTISQNDATSQSIQGLGYNSDAVLQNLGAAITVVAFPSVAINYKYNALFGRLNYTLKNKYIINLSGRRDGSTRFGKENQFHNFGAIGAAWIFSSEKFSQKKLPFLSFGKLRFSYGTTGNDQVADYSFLSLYNYSFGSYQGSSGIFPRNLSNPYLQWEETRKLMIGIDVGFINDRILINATYSRNRSSNQLLNYALPTITGYNSIATNFPATLQNESYEFALTSSIVKSKAISWTANFNFTIAQNKLAAFPNIEESSYASNYIVGKSISTKRILHFSGVDPTTGIYTFASKADPSTLIFPDDYTVLFDPTPKCYGGIQNSVSFKGFTLDFLFQYINQKKPSLKYGTHGGASPGVYLGQESNQPATIANQWQKPGDIATVQRFSTLPFTQIWSMAQKLSGSDVMNEDASFIRLRNLSFSWDVPRRWISSGVINKARIYFQGQNLLTFTKYKGMDPENGGVVSLLPPLRILTAGFQIEL